MAAAFTLYKNILIYENRYVKVAPMNNLSHFDSQPRSTTDTGAITALCKAAGDPLRMQVLKVLQQNAYGHIVSLSLGTIP